MATTRKSKPTPPKTDVASVRAAAQAEKARKAASKAALRAALAAKQAEAAPAEAAPVEQQPAPVEQQPAPAREARKAADAAAYEAAIRVDAEALGLTGEAADAYVAEHTTPADAKAAKTPYTGPMLALKAARKHYVKAANGIQCNGDKLATLCGRFTRPVVVAALIEALELGGNPYAHLNPGQQSMNLRNKARHAVNEDRLSLTRIEACLVAHSEEHAA